MQSEGMQARVQLQTGVCPAFLQVRAGLVPLIAELREKGSPPDDDWIKGKFNVDKQVGH